MNLRKESKLWFLVITSAIVLLALVFIISGRAWIRKWFAPNKPPVVIIHASPTLGEAPLEVIFDASESYDPDGDAIVSYKWEFENGHVQEGQNIRYGFASPGAYSVCLTVTDIHNEVGMTTITISVLEPDEKVITHVFDPREGTTFDTGAGLTVVVPPAQSEGKVEMAIRYDLTPIQPSELLLNIGSVYTVTMVPKTGSQWSSSTVLSTVQRLSRVKLVFDVPAGVDPRFAVILYWTDKGWVLADNKAGLPGGTVSPDGRHLQIEVEHTSTFAIAWVKWEGKLDSAVIPQVGNPSIDEQGHLVVPVVLESLQGILSLGKGAWYGIEVSTVGLQFIGVEAKNDWLFGRMEKNSGFIAPGENKELIFTFLVQEASHIFMLV